MKEKYIKRLKELTELSTVIKTPRYCNIETSLTNFIYSFAGNKSEALNHNLTTKSLSVEPIVIIEENKSQSKSLSVIKVEINT